MTHQEMANLIGCTRKTVSTTLGRFRNQGLIRCNGRAVTIVDEQSLSALLGYSGSTPLGGRDHYKEQWEAAVQSARGSYRDGWDKLRGADPLRS